MESMPYYYFFDPTYMLVLIGAILCICASVWVNSSMKKYHSERNHKGITGAEAAQQILRNAGIYDVRVECLQRGGGDHYDPRAKVVRLSYENFNYATVTAVAVAAHECGHAKQHQEGYGPLQFRTALVPVVNIGSMLWLPIILLGVFLSWNTTLLQIGIWVFALAVLFQVVTLPVEFNASVRAMQSIQSGGILDEREAGGAKKVLTAAAMTYVAATASSILQLLRIVMLFGGNRRRD